jgi:flagellar basal-body rod protein FlgC
VQAAPKRLVLAETTLLLPFNFVSIQIERLLMTQGLFSVTKVSASGMAAERLRMEIVANNIANANSTSTPEGGPYRRQTPIFAANGQAEFGSLVGNKSIQGVRVLGVEEDDSELPMVHIPGHPEADADGIVRMPNVKLPNEMVDMISASRSYEANLRAISVYKEMVEQTLALLRGR